MTGATSLLQTTGTLGLIATNTVAQGDTREVGLDRLKDVGFTITRAIQSRSWPAASANLEYAAVWGALGAVEDAAPRVADDVVVRRISTLLEPAGRIEGNPARLSENAGIAFQGCIVLGMGFVIEPEEAQEWIAADARNAEVLFPYLNGEDLNSRPDSSASRWVIDFNDRTEAEASKYTLPFARVLQKVKPERMHNNRDVYRRLWWQHAEKRPALRKATASLGQVLAIARISRTIVPARVTTSQVLNEKVVVYSDNSGALGAVLSSSIHQSWVVKYGTTLRADTQYTPSDVFETFPRPDSTTELEELGDLLDSERRALMLNRSLGLTKLYNIVNARAIRDDPDIARLRRLHAQIDKAVMTTYGWDDVTLEHGFYAYRSAERWSICPDARIEILDRLLEENHRRHHRERRRGSHILSVTADNAALFD